MQRLGTFEEARSKVLTDVRQCIARVQRISSEPFDDPDTAVTILQRLRGETYEDLNQIQHEHLILCAVDWLLTQRICPSDTQWYWNPRQTGDNAQPDLVGKRHGASLVSAEITTSANPEGKIDTRMRNTLAKLAQQSGRLFYFVRTNAMAIRANTKIRKGGWDIEVVRIHLHGPALSDQDPLSATA